MKKPKAIYLDVCALSRPFDDQGYLRIRIETEAVNLILTATREGFYKLMFSAVHDEEINAIDDPVERTELLSLLAGLGNRISEKSRIVRSRAEELAKMGFGVADAAHVAFAEYVGADFISCDDRLIKQCRNHDIKSWCGNPVGYCEKEGLK